MNPKSNDEQLADDALLRNLIALAEPASKGPVHELADNEELCELFVQGKLAGEDCEQFLQYLDANPQAREAMSEYLTFQDKVEENGESDGKTNPKTLSMTRASANSWNNKVTWSAVALAVAACLTLAVGINMWAPWRLNEAGVYKLASALTESEAFDQAQQWIEEARAEGIESPRLELLAARAAMHEANPLDSAEAWSLRDFDYEFDGTLIMDAEVDEETIARLDRADELVERVDPAEQMALLAKARLLLKRNKPAEARGVFETILKNNPAHPAALMGLGVANFMLGGEKLDDAEASFRQFLKTQPNSFAGRLNLAMCLSEAGKLPEAVAEWRKVDLSQLPPAERAAAERAISDLEQGIELQG